MRKKKITPRSTGKKKHTKLQVGEETRTHSKGGETNSSSKEKGDSGAHPARMREKGPGTLFTTAPDEGVFRLNTGGGKKKWGKDL